MDFTSDESFDGRKIRLLMIVEHITRGSLAIEVGPRMRENQVVSALEYLADRRSLPKAVGIDNGPEFIAKVVEQWAYANKVPLDFSRPGKLTDNAFIESFSGSVRAECRNES